MQSTSNTSTFISYAAHYLSLMTRNFWQQEGTLQHYLDFILCEIDPMLSRRRTPAEVIRVTNETADTKTFTLRPSGRWGGFKAGQYIRVETDINGIRIRRNYSISSSPQHFKHNRLIDITVKRVAEGLASNYLHDHVGPGEILHIGEACGEFVNESTAANPLYIAAGSGITPIMSMIIQGLEEPTEHATTLIYSVRTAQDVIFAKQLTALANKDPRLTFITHFSATTGHITPQTLAEYCPDLLEREIYLCGPQPFMDTAKAALKDHGVAADAIKTESFGLAMSTAHLTNDTNTNINTNGQVHFLASGKTIQATGDKTLLELAESAGLSPKFGCRSGVCHECKCSRADGKVLNKLTGELIPDEQQQIQACISIPVGELSVNNW